MGVPNCIVTSRHELERTRESHADKVDRWGDAFTGLGPYLATRDRSLRSRSAGTLIRLPSEAAWTTDWKTVPGRQSPLYVVEDTIQRCQ
jgi:hypothetical protein